MAKHALYKTTKIKINPGTLGDYVKPNSNDFFEDLRSEINANLFNSVDQAQEAADDWIQDYRVKTSTSPSVM